MVDTRKRELHFPITWFQPPAPRPQRARSSAPQASASPRLSGPGDPRGTLLAKGSGDVRFLALNMLVLSAADHWTTYLCLRQPIEGWLVLEANPISDWLFTSIGLVPGLLLDSALTVMALLFLLTTGVFPQRAKCLFLGIVSAWTAFAVHNNLNAIYALGLSPLGGTLS